MQAEIQTTLQDVSESQAAYNTAESELRVVGGELEQNLERLQQNEAELETAREQYSERAEGAYRSGGVMFLDVLLSGESFGDFSRRVEFVLRMAEQDQATVQQTREARSALGEERAELRERQDRQAQLVSDMRESRESTNERLESQQQMLAALETDVADLVQEEQERAARAAADQRAELARQYAEEQQREDQPIAATAPRPQDQPAPPTAPENNPDPEPIPQEAFPEEEVPDLTDRPSTAGPATEAPDRETPERASAGVPSEGNPPAEEPAANDESEETGSDSSQTVSETPDEASSEGASQTTDESADEDRSSEQYIPEDPASAGPDETGDAGEPESPAGAAEEQYIPEAPEPAEPQESESSEEPVEADDPPDPAGEQSLPEPEVVEPESIESGSAVEEQYAAKGREASDNGFEGELIIDEPVEDILLENADESGGGGIGGESNEETEGSGDEPQPTDPTAQSILDNPNISMYPGVRQDIAAGIVDQRVLDVIAFAASSYSIELSAIKTGHPYGNDPTLDALGYVGFPNAHYFGRAVDISSVNGAPVSPGNEAAYQLAADLYGNFGPEELGSPWTFGAGSFSDALHQDHLHIGWTYGPGGGL